MEKNKQKALFCVITASAVYALCTAAITIININLRGESGLDISVSISRYVARELWSVIANLASNLVTCAGVFMLLHYIKAPLVYRVNGYIIIALMLCVAVCPTSNVFGPTLTAIHQVTSRALFIGMMIHTATGLFYYPKKKRFLIPNIIVTAADAAMMTAAFTINDIFMSRIYLFEALIITGYIISLFTVWKEVFAEDDSVIRN